MNGRADGRIDGGGGREWEQWETTPNDAGVVREDKDLDDDKDAPFLPPIVVVVGGGGAGGREGDQGGGTTMTPRGRRRGHSRPLLRPPPLHLAPPRARRRRARRGTAVATAHRRGSRPGFPGPSWGGGRPEAVAASTTVPRCHCPPGAALSPPPPCRPDGLTVTTVMTAPARRPAATPAMATPLSTMTLPPPLLPAKRTMRDRRTTTAAGMMGTTTRMMTSGGGASSSTRPPPRRHCLSATLSAMPLPWPALCCPALRCPGSASNTATP